MDNPYQSPEVEETLYEDAIVGNYALADRSTRFVAAMIDGICMAILVFPLVYLVSWIFGVGFFAGDDFVGEQLDWGPFLLEQLVGAVASFAISVVIYTVLNGYLLAKNGQTIGKNLFGIKIVRKDGSAVEAGHVVWKRFGIMQAMSLLPLIGGLIGLVNVLFIFRKSRYCLHDDIADTVVVKA